MTAAVVLAGLLSALGLVGVVAGLRRTERVPRRPARPETAAQVWARVTRRPAGAAGRRRDAFLLASLVIGVGIAAFTGWLLAILIAPALALSLPYLLILPKQRDLEVMEALDRWVRSLAATMATGRSVTDSIRASGRTAPPLIADEVNVLIVRLNNRWETRDALLRFADALGSPDADGVIAALVLAANRGANGASRTLKELADSIQSQLKGRRELQVEQAKPYTVVRQVTVISLSTLALIAIASPSFFSAYATPVGELVLAGLLALYLGSLLLMRRRAARPPRPRILVGERP